MTFIVAFEDADSAREALEQVDGQYEILPVEDNGNAFVGVADESQYVAALSELIRLAVGAGVSTDDIREATDNTLVEIETKLYPEGDE
jgi:hypothetical protein